MNLLNNSNSVFLVLLGNDFALKKDPSFNLEKEICFSCCSFCFLRIVANLFERLLSIRKIITRERRKTFSKKTTKLLSNLSNLSVFMIFCHLNQTAFELKDIFSRSSLMSWVYFL
jgi:hypothetical protein